MIWAIASASYGSAVDNTIPSHWSMNLSVGCYFLDSITDNATSPILTSASRDSIVLERRGKVPRAIKSSDVRFPPLVSEIEPIVG